MGLNGQKVNLFIVGAAKCGTTSLHDWLDFKEHSGILCQAKRFCSNCIYSSSIQSFSNGCCPRPKRLQNRLSRKPLGIF